MLSRGFFKKLSRMCRKLGMNPRDLLLVMFLESGVNPQVAHSKTHTAQGLIQFMPNTLKGMGLSKEQIANFSNLSGEDQLDYVEKYIVANQRMIGGKPFTSASQYYHANFYPGTLHRWRGTDPLANAGVIVASRNAKSANERLAYTSNTGLDFNKDGAVTVGDLTNLLLSLERKPAFQQFLKRLNEADGPGEVTDKELRKGNKPNHPTMDDEEPARSVRYKTNDNSIMSFISTLNKLLDSFQIAAGNNMEKINKYAGFPKNKFLICVNADTDLPSKIEFARVLSSAIKEELDSTADIFANNDNVEVECEIYANKEKAQDALNQLCFAISDTFEYATRKIGGTKVFTMVVPDSKSNYQRLDIKLAELNYRKFQLKFLAN